MEKTLVVKNLLGSVTSQEVAASGDWTSGEVDLSKRAYEGIFCLAYTATGSGTFKIEYQASLDNATWVTPTSGNEIETGLTAGSDLLSFDPIPCAFIRILVTETGTSDEITLTKLNLMIQ